jgi:hypothetical protein
MELSESILTSIKKMLGIEEEYTHFDPDIIMHINSVFMTLFQLGIGPKGFNITDDEATWSDYVSNINELQAIKPYIYAKVRLAFDPPSSGTLVELMKQQIAEMEWRLNVMVDPTEME